LFPYKGYQMQKIFCNTGLSIDQRVDALFERMMARELRARGAHLGLVLNGGL